jgi:hypothetical protein
MRRPFNGTYPVTNDFGTPNPAYAAIYGRRHPGTDYGMPIGTPLCSPVDGVVTAARLDRSGFGRGYFVEILSDGKYYGLCHMNSVAVSEGQQVTEGTPIGPSGNTGLSTGPHLHMYVCLSPSPNVPLDQFLDPEELLNSAEAQGDTKMLTENDVDVMRIIETEIKGFDYEFVHSGQFDKELLGAHAGKDCRTLVREQFHNSVAAQYRANKVALVERVKQLEKENAELKKNGCTKDERAFLDLRKKI